MKIEHIRAKKRCNWNIHRDSETKWMDFREKFLFWQRKGTGTPLFPNTGSPILRIFSLELSAADACFRAWKQNPSCLCLGGQIGCLASGQNSPFLTAVGGGACVPAGNRPSPSGAFASSFLYLFFSFLYWGRQTATSRHPDGNQPATGRKQNRWVAACADSRLFAVSYAKLHNSPFVHLCRYAKKPCAGAFFVDKAEGNWYP